MRLPKSEKKTKGDQDGGKISASAGGPIQANLQLGLGVQGFHSWILTMGDWADIYGSFRFYNSCTEIQVWSSSQLFFCICSFFGSKARPFPRFLCQRSRKGKLASSRKYKHFPWASLWRKFSLLLSGLPETSGDPPILPWAECLTRETLQISLPHAAARSLLNVTTDRDFLHKQSSAAWHILWGSQIRTNYTYQALTLRSQRLAHCSMAHCLHNQSPKTELKT